MNRICITGANSGMGYETARALALKGHHVLAASRSKPETLATMASLNDACRQSGAGGRVDFFHLDLTDLSSVRAFVTEVRWVAPQVDTLICNAGIMNAPHQLTGDGFESHFQVNFLSQYLLTRLLMDTLLQSPQPKVIHICSASAEKGRIHDTDVLEREAKVRAPDYDAMTAYRESKLAQQAAIMALSRMDMFRAVRWSLVHPGVVNTNLFYRNQGAWYKWVMKPFVWAGYAVGFFKTPKQGADTAIYLAESGDYPSGGYWHNRKPLDPNPISLDAAYGQALLAWTNKVIAV